MSGTENGRSMKKNGKAAVAYRREAQEERQKKNPPVPPISYLSRDRYLSREKKKQVRRSVYAPIGLYIYRIHGEYRKLF